MNQSFISLSQHSRLILIFLGWGMDATPFAHLSKPGYDIMALWDYTDYTGCNPNVEFEQLQSSIDGYREIVVVAWSFGVRIASDFLNHAKPLPVTRAIAVNGTEQHIHDTLGIPCAIAHGTLRNLSETSVRKFRRRMFASASDFSLFQQDSPQRSFDSLRNELATFIALPTVTSPAQWERAVIGGADAIFPPGNQKDAWGGTPVDVIANMPHYPDFQQILSKYIIDKELVARRFTQSSETYSANATPQQKVAAHLWELTSAHIPQHERPLEIIEIGAGCGTLTSLYIESLKNNHIRLWDIAQTTPDNNIAQNAISECCDAEVAIRSVATSSVDAILSSSTLQWFNSPAAFIGEISRVLTPGGIAALAFYTVGTYAEIEQATGTGLKYPSLEHLCSIAGSHGLNLLHKEENATTLNFPSMPRLLQHIRDTGVNAITSESSPVSALRIMRRYRLLDNGTAPLTYCPAYLILTKPL